MKDDQSRILSGKGNFHTIDFRYQDISASDTGTQKRNLPSVGICQCNFCSIWMGAVNVTCGNVYFQAGFFCQFRSLSDTHIISSHSHDSGDQCLVCTMAFVGFCKGTVKEDICFYSRSSKECPCNTADPGSAGSMGAGRTDHNRTKYVKYVHKYTFFDLDF